MRSLSVIVVVGDDDLVTIIGHRCLSQSVDAHAARGVSRSLITRHTRNHRVARPVRARARRRVTLVKFQPGIYRLKRRHRNADTWERQTETERTRNGEK